MEPLHIIPVWFVNFQIVFQLLFFVATAIIAGYAFRVYNLSKQRESRNLALSFSFLSASYLILTVANFFFLSVSGNMRVLELENILGIRMLSVGLYITLAILGFVTLFYTTLKTKSSTNYLALALLSLVAIAITCNKSLMIYFVASLFLILITFNYFRDYFRTKNKNTLLISVGMLFLLLTNLCLGFSADKGMANAYVLSNFLEIVGYGFIISSLARIINNGQKKK
jgi:hypothetical protein